MKIKNNKGFTLVEVLAVIVILVIIVAIAVPNLEPAVKRQECKLLDSKAKLIIEQAKFYIEDNWREVEERRKFEKDGSKFIYKKCRININPAINHISDEYNDGITSSEIVQKGYLKPEDLINDKEPLVGYVTYNYDTKKYNFCLILGAGDDCNDLKCNATTDEEKIPEHSCVAEEDMEIITKKP